MNGPARSPVDSVGVLRSSSESLVDTRPNRSYKNTERQHPAVPGNDVSPMLPVYSVTCVPGRSGIGQGITVR